MKRTIKVKVARENKLITSIEEFRREYSIAAPKGRQSSSVEELARRTAERVIKAAERK